MNSQLTFDKLITYDFAPEHISISLNDCRVYVESIIKCVVSSKYTFWQDNVAMADVAEGYFEYEKKKITTI
jgi:hypothetical protein